MKTRKELPPAARIAQRVDLNSLTAEFEQTDLLNIERYQDFDYSDKSAIKALLAENLDVRKLAMNSDEVASASFDPETYRSRGYRQLSLTEANLQAETARPRGPVSNSVKTRLRRLDRNSAHYDARTDERNYGVLKTMAGPVLRSLTKGLGGKLCRVRLAALLPGAEIQPHRDYDPSYLSRYHIPISTNAECRLFVKQQNKTFAFRLPADGSIYFLNAGLVHWVENRGQSPRIHLIVDIDGQLPLSSLEEIESESVK